MQNKPSIVSHVPMLSHPKFVLDVIRTAAQAVQRGEGKRMEPAGAAR